MLINEIICRLQVQSRLQENKNTYNSLTLVLGHSYKGLEQSTLPPGLNKKFSSKFHVGSSVQHGTPEEGQRTHWLKCCEYSNEDEDNSPSFI